MSEFVPLMKPQSNTIGWYVKTTPMLDHRFLHIDGTTVSTSGQNNKMNFYFASEAEAYRGMHHYYHNHNKGYDFPYHDEFMEAHHMKGIMTDGQIESETMGFE